MLGRVRRLDGARQVAEAPACTAPERKMLTARRLRKRYGEKRGLRGLDPAPARGGVPRVSRGARPRAAARRLPRRHRAERLREDDAAADLRRPRAADGGDDRAERDSRAGRLSRARPARLQRADGAPEPRALRAPLPRARAARADRHAAGAFRALGGTARPRRLAPWRHDTAAPPLPRPAPPARAAR